METRHLKSHLVVHLAVLSITVLTFPVSPASAQCGWLDPTCSPEKWNKPWIKPPKNTPAEAGCPECQPLPLCVTVDARRGWQDFGLRGTFARITSISGNWSVDAQNYQSVGAFGHGGRDAERLAPYNQYKYSQRFPFGALLVAIPNSGYSWISQPQQLSRSTNSVSMRINDADNALGDNSGSMRVCFGN